MKSAKKLFTILLAVLMVCSMAACGTTPEGNKTNTDGTSGTGEAATATKADVLAYLETLKTGKADGLNTYESSFDDIVNHLIEKGVISADTTPVDMITTEGYLTDNMGDGSFATYAFADKALDYNGVYIMWWNLKEPTEAISVYAGIPVNQMVVIDGGAATMNITSWSGSFAIGFKEGTDSAVIDAGKKAFDEIDKTACCIDYMMNASELALALKEAGLIEAADIAGMKDLNAEYKYTSLDYNYDSWDDAAGTFTQTEQIESTVYLASEAKAFGKVTIYYFDTLNGLEYTDKLDAVYEDAQNNKVIKPYCCFDRTAMEYEYVPYTHKDGVYAADGETLSLPVDVVIGRFAIAIAE